MDGITLKVEGTLTAPLKQLKDELPRAEKRALYRAAYYLRSKIRESLSSAIPKATQSNPKYNDTLVDAVGFTKVDGASLNINAMGNRKKGSGTFRARFFEAGTKDRYQKNRNGVKLQKKKYIGKIKPTWFFHKAVNANEAQAIKLMEDVISEYVNIAMKNTNR
jgi:hypothetical protein